MGRVTARQAARGAALCRSDGRPAVLQLSVGSYLGPRPQRSSSVSLHHYGGVCA